MKIWRFETEFWTDGGLMGANSCDYFLFTPGAFDWETFPKCIFGNVAYDQVRRF